MPQRTRGAVEEGTVTFLLESEKDVIYDQNQAGRSHQSVPSIKCIGIDNTIYNAPISTSETINTLDWQNFSSVDVVRTAADGAGSPKVPTQTMVLRFLNDGASVNTSRTTFIPKLRINFRLAGGGLGTGGSSPSGGASDFFEIQASEDKISYTTVTEKPRRSTDGGANYSILSTAGKVLATEIANDRFHHYYVDVDISAFNSQSIYIKFKTTLAGSGKSILLTGTQFEALDFGEYSSNVGVSFTNVTISGFKIILSARFTGTVRYLCSSYE